MTTTQTLKVELKHRSSISNARWCQPVGWEPANEIAGEFIDGSWWSESQEEAGLVCFVQGDEGDVIEVPVDELRVASCGDCRVIGEVETA
jgi:hypothetical protein